MKIKKEAILTMAKKTARLQDITAGINTISYNRVYKNKKAYDRKENKRMIFQY